MYKHTQQSPLHVLLYLPAIFLFFVAWQLRNDLPPSLVISVVAICLLVLSLTFQRLTVKDDDEFLDIHYGPLNWFGTRIRYADITDVNCGKSSWIDGWGIHFIPFRGWTINLWGFECVEITRGNKMIRIGTDDSENLAEFLRERCGLEPSAETANESKLPV